MTSLLAAAPASHTVANAPIWNVCLTHDPSLAGLYRGINDFSRALAAPILSFDDGRSPRTALSAKDSALRILCGGSRITRDCHVMPRHAAREAADILDAAELLIVHSLFRAHAPWAACWAHEHRRRYWAVPHGCLDPWGLSQRRMAKHAWLTIHGRPFLAGAERVVFSTQRALDKARPWVPGGNAVVVRWPVDLPCLDDREQQRLRFRQRLGIPTDIPLLLFVGRLHAVKRPLETIERFCTADTGGGHLVMVCLDGQLTKADLERAIPPTHAGRIHVVGPLDADDLASAYLASDGFISLSFQENFGYAAAEAVAHGLPVILSPGHDLAHEMPRDATGQLACGWLLPDDSGAAAEQAIAEWATLAADSPANAPRLTAMGATGRAWSAESLSFETFQNNLRYLARM
jgi:glycosyltransferase involved in cell wall biosynthesis